MRGNPPQVEVARRIGCAPRSYQNWELGTSTPSWRYAELLGAYFGVSPEYVLHGVSGNMPHPAEDQLTLAEIHSKLDEILRALNSLGARDHPAEDPEPVPPGAPNDPLPQQSDRGTGRQPARSR